MKKHVIVAVSCLLLIQVAYAARDLDRDTSDAVAYSKENIAVTERVLLTIRDIWKIEKARESDTLASVSVKKKDLFIRQPIEYITRVQQYYPSEPNVVTVRFSDSSLHGFLALSIYFTEDGYTYKFFEALP